MWWVCRRMLRIGFDEWLVGMGRGRRLDLEKEQEVKRRVGSQQGFGWEIQRQIARIDRILSRERVAVIPTELGRQAKQNIMEEEKTRLSCRSISGVTEERKDIMVHRLSEPRST